MKGIITLFFIVGLGAQAAPAAPGIQVALGSRIDGTLPAITDGGDTVVDTRELRVDLQFPSGKRGKGAAFLIFDRTTGYYLWLDRWEGDDYPKTITAKTVGFDRRIGVTGEGMFLFRIGNPVMIFRSTEKAGSMDEAESSYVKWAGGHMAEIEAHQPHTKLWAQVDLGAFQLMPGLVPDGLRPQAGVPIELLAITRNDKHWELTIQGKYKVKARLANGSPWDAGGTPVLALELGPDAVVCLGDRMQEIECPKLPEH